MILTKTEVIFYLCAVNSRIEKITIHSANKAEKPCNDLF